MHLKKGNGSASLCRHFPFSCEQCLADALHPTKQSLRKKGEPFALLFSLENACCELVFCFNCVF